MKRVTIVGGGFSGLTAAYYLARGGASVTLVEKQQRLGGMVDTLATPHGLVETAASGIRNSGRLEELCRELGVPLVHTMKESRKRFLYRNGRPTQWPLSFGESFGFAGKLGAHLVTGSFRPRAGETVDVWGSRVIGVTPTRKILGAVLQGIYAGDPAALSASLILGKREKPPKPSKAGLVAPPNGLAQLTAAIVAKLEDLGVEMRTGSSVDGLPDGVTVLATSARDCSVLLRERAPETSTALASIEMVPLLRVTAFYETSENSWPGFGTLFPRDEGVRALGVLFNTNIFPNRGEGHSESWIYGGAQDRAVLDLDDAALFDVLDRDRERLVGKRVEPIARYPQRWHTGLPHYDLHLERLAPTNLPLPENVFLTGNYLRGIGLPMLLEQSHAVAERILA
jgi:oxygen-dependent protoporphyrinogen oxidase